MKRFPIVCVGDDDSLLVREPPFFDWGWKRHAFFAKMEIVGQTVAALENGLSRVLCRMGLSYDNFYCSLLRIKYK